MELNAGNIIRGNNCGGSPRTDDPKLSASLVSPVDGSPGYFSIASDSPARNNAATVACNAAGNVDQRGVTRPQGSGCDIGAYEYDGSTPPPVQEDPPLIDSPRQNDNPPPQNENPPPQNDNPPPDDRDSGDNDEDEGDDRDSRDNDEDGGDDADDRDDSKRETAALNVVVTPRVSTCLSVPGIQVSRITPWTQCQRVDGVGIGNADVAAAGFVDAIDVWGWVLPNMGVCFTASGGSFKFIDTTVLPRVIHDLPAVAIDGMTCATISHAGILVLRPGTAPAQTPPAQQTPAPAQSRGNRLELHGDTG